MLKELDELIKVRSRNRLKEWDLLSLFKKHMAEHQIVLYLYNTIEYI